MSKSNSTKEIIFISGRFRSGTSMLWNVFNQLPQYHTWYEPLHPNLLSHIKYVKPKQDHIGIDDYWTNYRKLEGIESFYSQKFGQYKFFLEKHESWNALEKYINFLIEHSEDKIPVLQFNRMDLRLSWLKNTFPEATFISINREPYPLWLSSRKHILLEFDKEDESYPDGYDLMQWSADLSVKFPMLQQKNNRSSYYRHYFIWLLSQKLAKYNSDLQLSLENDFLHTQSGLKKLAQLFQWDNADLNLVDVAIQKPKSMQSNPKKDKLYSEIETEINNLFQSLGLKKLFPSSLLNSIKLEYISAWNEHSYHPETTVQELLDALKFQKDELTTIISNNN